MTTPFVKLGIDSHGGLNRETLSRDLDQGSVIGGAGPSLHCHDMCALLTDASAI